MHAHTGGGVFRSAANGTANIQSCLFVNNTAAEGGAIWEQTIASGSIQGSVFSGNQAAQGAAIYSRVSETAIGPGNSNLTPQDVVIASA